jgi:hypothetical protein
LNGLTASCRATPTLYGYLLDDSGIQTIVADVNLLDRRRRGRGSACGVLCPSALWLAARPADLGELNFGDERDVTLRVKNVSDREICVTGLRTTCTCVSASDLPLALAPGAEGEVALAIRATALFSNYRQTATLYVSGQASGEVPVTIESEIGSASMPESERTGASGVAPSGMASEPPS